MRRDLTAAIALRGLKAAPLLADSTTYLHNKAALRKYAADTYDYFLTALKEATPAQLRRPVRCTDSRRNPPPASLPWPWSIRSGPSDRSCPTSD